MHRPPTAAQTVKAAVAAPPSPVTSQAASSLEKGSAGTLNNHAETQQNVSVPEGDSSRSANARVDPPDNNKTHAQHLDSGAVAPSPSSTAHGARAERPSISSVRRSSATDERLGEYMWEAVNEADMPPGLLRFLQWQKQHASSQTASMTGSSPPGPVTPSRPPSSCATSTVPASADLMAAPCARCHTQLPSSTALEDRKLLNTAAAVPSPPTLTSPIVEHQSPQRKEQQQLRPSMSGAAPPQLSLTDTTTTTITTGTTEQSRASNAANPPSEVTTAQPEAHVTSDLAEGETPSSDAAHAPVMSENVGNPSTRSPARSPGVLSDGAVPPVTVSITHPLETGESSPMDGDRPHHHNRHLYRRERFTPSPLPTMVTEMTDSGGGDAHHRGSDEEASAVQWRLRHFRRSPTRDKYAANKPASAAATAAGTRPSPFVNRTAQPAYGTEEHQRKGVRAHSNGAESDHVGSHHLDGEEKEEEGVASNGSTAQQDQRLAGPQQPQDRKRRCSTTRHVVLNPLPQLNYPAYNNISSSNHNHNNSHGSLLPVEAVAPESIIGPLTYTTVPPTLSGSFAVSLAGPPPFTMPFPDTVTPATSAHVRRTLLTARNMEDVPLFVRQQQQGTPQRTSQFSPHVLAPVFTSRCTGGASLLNDSAGGLNYMDLSNSSNGSNTTTPSSFGDLEPALQAGVSWMESFSPYTSFSSHTLTLETTTTPTTANFGSTTFPNSMTQNGGVPSVAMLAFAERSTTRAAPALRSSSQSLISRQSRRPVTATTQHMSIHSIIPSINVSVTGRSSAVLPSPPSPSSSGRGIGGQSTHDRHRVLASPQQQQQQQVHPQSSVLGRSASFNASGADSSTSSNVHVFAALDRCSAILRQRPPAPPQQQQQLLPQAIATAATVDFALSRSASPPNTPVF
jgi:hypothetical protein